MQRQIYNLGEPVTPTLFERIQRLGNLVGWGGKIVILPKERLPSHLQMNLQWQYHWATDTARFREELGYVEPIAEQEALRQTIVWEQENLTATSTEQLNDYLAEDEAMKCVIGIQSHQPISQLPAPPKCSETHRVENHPGR